MRFAISVQSGMRFNKPGMVFYCNTFQRHACGRKIYPDKFETHGRSASALISSIGWFDFCPVTSTEVGEIILERFLPLFFFPKSFASCFLPHFRKLIVPPRFFASVLHVCSELWKKVLKITRFKRISLAYVSRFVAFFKPVHSLG